MFYSWSTCKLYTNRICLCRFKFAEELLRLYTSIDKTTSLEEIWDFHYLKCKVSWSLDRGVESNLHKFRSTCETIQRTLKRKFELLFLDHRSSFSSTKNIRLWRSSCAGETRRKAYNHATEIRLLSVVKGRSRLDMFQNEDIRMSLNCLYCLKTSCI